MADLTIVVDEDNGISFDTDGYVGETCQKELDNLLKFLEESQGITVIDKKVQRKDGAVRTAQRGSVSH